MRPPVPADAVVVRLAHVARAYTLFYVIGTMGAMRVPVVGWAPLRSLEQLGPFGGFIMFQVRALLPAQVHGIFSVARFHGIIAVARFHGIIVVARFHGIIAVVWFHGIFGIARAPRVLRWAAARKARIGDSEGAVVQLLELAEVIRRRKEAKEQVTCCCVLGWMDLVVP